MSRRKAAWRERMTQLKSLTLRGFKSIRELVDFRFEPVTVLIGANGSGKSNLLSFFKMLSFSLNTPGELQTYVAQTGGASAMLHDGAQVTREIEWQVTVVTERGDNDYHSRLVFAAGDTLIYAEERYRFSPFGTVGKWHSLGSGHRESKLPDAHEHLTARVIHGELRKFRQFQFHNTSSTARVRTRWSESDGRYLKEDGGNLAPFLYRLREQEEDHYVIIIDTIRQVAPFFADFQLNPEHGRLLLGWREQGSDVVFNASQAPDGLLRFMILAALLLQPPDDLPSLILLDEPELGLHPYAIDILAGLIKACSRKTQLIVATQSTTLLDHFAPEQTVVVSREGRASTFQRLASADLEQWLEDYTLSDLWRKNVVGGRP
ncbi:MAG: AAA family ATPase [Candidatus Eremiobacterota bacterium]